MFLGSEVSVRHCWMIPLGRRNHSPPSLQDLMLWSWQICKTLKVLAFFFLFKIYLTSVNLKPRLLQMADSLIAVVNSSAVFWENFGCYNHPSKPEKIDFNPHRDVHMAQPLNLAAAALSKGVPFSLSLFRLSCTACKSRMCCLGGKSREAQDEMNQGSFFSPDPICLPGVSEMVGGKISWLSSYTHFICLFTYF